MDGRQTRMIFHDGSSRQTEYDALGRRTAEIDEAGMRTEFVYAPTGELLEVHQPDPANLSVLSTVTRYEYDSLGRKVRQIDALGRATTFDYTVRGEFLSRARPLGEREGYTYDHQGNLATRIDAIGRTTTYSYNGLNLISSKSFSDGSSQAFTYFPGGQRATFTRGSEVTAFALDNRNRLSSQTNPDGTALAWTYDSLGNRTGVTVSQFGVVSQQIAYSWTARNELHEVFRSGQLWATYSYDDAGNRRSLAYANGTSQTLDYNSKNQLLAIRNRNGSGGILSSYAYTLDPRGMRLGVLEESGRTVAYAYDGLKRLIQEQITESGSITTIGYLLDRVGNRLQKQVLATSTQTTAYSYNDNDQLLSESGPDGLINYGYDANGQTTQKTAAGVGTVTYSWDFEGRMIGTLAPSESLAFGYDLDGIRIAKSVNGVVTRFTVDKNRDYAQVLEERDQTGVTQVAYVYGDDLLTQERSTGISFYHSDGQLSTRQLTDFSAQVTDRYSYDAFGKLISQVGSTNNTVRYDGEQQDPALNFYYLRARYLNQAIGRFVSLDTYSGDATDPSSLHKYLYSDSDPVNHRDPSGNFGIASLSINVTFNLSYKALAVIPLAFLASCAATFGLSFALSAADITVPPNIGGPTPFCNGDLWESIWIYRSMTGTNPGAFRVDSDGVSFFEYKKADFSRPFQMFLRVRYLKPKVAGTIGTITTAPLVGIAIATYTPWYGDGHWSVSFPTMSEDEVKKLLSRLMKGLPP